MFDRNRTTFIVAVVALLAIVAGLTACGGGGGGTNGGTTVAGAHADIPLRSESGALIMAGSTEPYSPRATCGACHDVDQAASGYHFQQGRLDAAGAVQTQDDFYNDGRGFVRSDGMYGKW